MSAFHQIVDLLTSPPDPDWSLRDTAERLLRLAARTEPILIEVVSDGESRDTCSFRIEQGDRTVLSGDAASTRIIRPLLACLARLAESESDIAFDPYGGRLRFRRKGANGKLMAVNAAFQNTSGTQRLELASERWSGDRPQPNETKSTKALVESTHRRAASGRPSAAGPSNKSRIATGAQAPPARPSSSSDGNQSTATHAFMPGDWPLLDPPTCPDAVANAGPYCLFKEIGRGGFGIVFEGQSPEHESVAVKVLIPVADAAKRKWVLERFKRECQLQKDSAPSCVPHYRHHGSTAQGTPYLVTELLTGRTLDAWLEAGARFSEFQVVMWGLQLAEAVQELHTANAQCIVHRDLDPKNIWVEFPGLRILDLGCARDPATDAELTQAGIGFGHPRTIDPTVSPANLQDVRSDLFSMGCILYRMWKGLDAWPRGTHHALQSGALPQGLDAGEIAALELENRLGAVVLRLMNVDRSKRHRSTHELISDLKRLLIEEAGAKSATEVAAPVRKAAVEKLLDESSESLDKLVGEVVGQPVRCDSNRSQLLAAAAIVQAGRQYQHAMEMFAYQLKSCRVYQLPLHSPPNLDVQDMLRKAYELYLHAVWPAHEHLRRSDEMHKVVRQIDRIWFLYDGYFREILKQPPDTSLSNHALREAENAAELAEEAIREVLAQLTSLLAPIRLRLAAALTAD